MTGSLIQFFQQTLPLTEEKAMQIAAAFQPVSLQKGTYFVKKGQVSNRYLFLETGCMRAYAMDTSGTEVTTELYLPQQVVFEVASFFKKVPAAENYQALEDCTGQYITFDDLQTLFHAVPEFRELGRMILVNGFIAFKQRTLALISDTAEQRYEQLLATRPALLQHVPLKYIASYLGITDTSLSRIRKEMAQKHSKAAQ
ncbi:MAG: Crp/Fnr family transcriptional regulator [Bacteroidetes bacterium]|nr:Crp/Fnr family transcriptional regulator [Bacteroidota bacterium]